LVGVLRVETNENKAAAAAAAAKATKKRINFGIFSFKINKFSQIT